MKSYCVGVDILKCIACFGVTALHFGRNVQWFAVAVPVFMFISTYLCGRLFSEGSWQELLLRLRRLYVPFIAWGMIYFAVLMVYEHAFNWRILLTQLLLGTPACPVLYFIALLASFSIILYLSGHCHCRQTLMVAIFCLCITLQYSGLNAMLFDGMQFDVKMVLGRFLELLPAAILGYGYYLHEYRMHNKYIVMLFVGLAIFYFYCVAVNLPFGCSGFSYQGVPILLGTLGIGGVMLSINYKVGAFVHQMATLTAGIYYTHLLVGKLLEMKIGKQRGWLESIAVFCLAACVVAVMKRIRWLRELVR